MRPRRPTSTRSLSRCHTRARRDPRRSSPPPRAPANSHPASTTPHGSADLEPQPKRAARRQPSSRANETDEVLTRHRDTGRPTHATPCAVACLRRRDGCRRGRGRDRRDERAVRKHPRQLSVASRRELASLACTTASSELNAGSRGMDPRSTERTKAPLPQLARSRASEPRRRGSQGRAVPQAATPASPRDPGVGQHDAGRTQPAERDNDLSAH